MQLQKDSSNTVYLTLTEKTTIDSPTYLFILNSDNQNVDYAFIATDTATDAQKARYNKFTITEGVDDPLNGSIDLGPTGTYHLTVYEQASTTNLDKTLAGNIVERIECLVIPSDELATIQSKFIYNTIDIQYSVNG